MNSNLYFTDISDEEEMDNGRIIYDSSYFTTFPRYSHECRRTRIKKKTIRNSTYIHNSCANLRQIYDRVRANAGDTDSTSNSIIREYKMRLNMARLFLAKSEKTLLSGGSLTPEMEALDRESEIIIQKEEERLRNGFSYSGFLNLSNETNNNENAPAAKRSRTTTTTDNESSIDNVTSSQPEASSSNPVTESEIRVIDPRTAIISLDALMPLSEISKQTLKICIIDKSSDDWRISNDNFSLIEEKIQDVIIDLFAGKKLIRLPNFHMTEKYRGHRVISCENDFSLQFLKDAVQNLGEIWSGAKLEVKLLHEIPSDPVISINLPVRHNDIKKSTSLLACHNPDFPVKKWSLVAFGNNLADKTPVKLMIDEESLKHLKTKSFELFFGLRTLTANEEKTPPNFQYAQGVSIENIMQDADITDLLDTNLVLEDNILS